MRAAMCVSYVVATDVCVDFGGRDAGMPEHGLYAAQVGAASQQVSRK